MNSLFVTVGVSRPHTLSSQLHVNYLLAWLDVRVDVFEHWLEHGIVAHTQVLDLDLAVLGPVLRHLRGVWRERITGGLISLSLLFTVSDPYHTGPDNTSLRPLQQKTEDLLLVSCLHNSPAGVNRNLKTIWTKS